MQRNDAGLHKRLSLVF